MIRIFRAVTLSLIGLFSWATVATAQTFETDADIALIMDFDTGLIMFEKDARKPTPPASMTKIMTAQMVFEAIASGQITEDTQYTVSEDAWRRGGFSSGSSTMALEIGSEVAVMDLLRGIIIQSGNDACITVAEGLAGSEAAFAANMTARAQNMGLASANFVNATGWPDAGHEISAMDLAKLSRLQISQFPDYYALYAERDFTWNGVKQFNRNPLLGRVDGADGIKTGYTSVSQYGLVGSAKRDGVRRIVVLNGVDSENDRRRVAAELIEASFNTFDVMDLASATESLDPIPVFMGVADEVSLMTRGPVHFPILKAERGSISAKVEYTVPAAPIAKGDEVATLIVTHPSGRIDEFPLYAGDAVARKGFFARVMTSLKHKILGTTV